MVRHSLKRLLGTANFFHFRTQSTSILKIAESSDLSNQSDDDNEDEETDDEELHNAIREVVKEENKILFVYQNCKMRHLYKHYGRSLILLNAKKNRPYKTMKYALPLYFMVVQTIEI